MTSGRRVWKIEEKDYFKKGDNDEFIKLMVELDEKVDGNDLMTFYMDLFDGDRKCSMGRVLWDEQDKIQMLKLIDDLQAALTSVAKEIKDTPLPATRGRG